MWAPGTMGSTRDDFTGKGGPSGTEAGAGCPDDGWGCKGSGPGWEEAGSADRLRGGKGSWWRAGKGVYGPLSTNAWSGAEAGPYSKLESVFGGAGLGMGAQSSSRPKNSSNPTKKRKNGYAACWYFSRNLCGRGKECTYSHDPEFCAAIMAEENEKTGAPYKSQLCVFYSTKGCKFGRFCWNSHGAADFEGEVTRPPPLSDFQSASAMLPNGSLQAELLKWPTTAQAGGWVEEGFPGTPGSTGLPAAHLGGAESGGGSPASWGTGELAISCGAAAGQVSADTVNGIAGGYGATFSTEPSPGQMAVGGYGATFSTEPAPGQMAAGAAMPSWLQQLQPQLQAVPEFQFQLQQQAQHEAQQQQQLQQQQLQQQQQHQHQQQMLLLQEQQLLLHQQQHFQQFLQ